jgi:maleate isomerase
MTSTLAPKGCIAVAVPWGNVTTQVEMDRLRPDGVVNVVGHFDLGPSWPDHVTDTCEHLLAFDPMVILIGLHPEMTGNLSLLHQAVGAIDTQAPVVIAVDAVLAALSKRGIQRVSVVTPGSADQHRRVEAVFAEQNVVVVHHVGMERGLGNIGNTPLELVRASLKDADHPDAQAIVQLGTNLPASELARTLAKEVGKPVLSANGCLYEAALEVCHPS